ncbi:MAG: TetR family transcriptional regulator [Candidatus Acidiferrales bacterium]
MATLPNKLPQLSRRKAGRRERHRTEIRERLYRAALDLFAERGFLRTTVEDITEAADVGKGTFFNYFPTKEHILAEFGGAYLAAVQKGLDAARETKGPIIEVLHDLATNSIRQINENEALIRAIYAAHASCESVRGQLQQRVQSCRKLLAEIIQLGQQRGEVRRDIPAADLSRLMQGIMMGVTMGWSIYPSAALRKVLEETWALMEPGLRGAASHTGGSRRRRSK